MAKQNKQTAAKLKLTHYKKVKELKLPPGIAQYIQVWESLTAEKTPKDQIWVFTRLDGLKSNPKEVIALMGLFCNEYERINMSYLDNKGSKTPECFLRTIPILRTLLPVYWMAEGAKAYVETIPSIPESVKLISTTWETLMSNKVPSPIELDTWIGAIQEFNYWENSLKENTQ